MKENTWGRRNVHPFNDPLHDTFELRCLDERPDEAPTTQFGGSGRSGACSRRNTWTEV